MFIPKNEMGVIVAFSEWLKEQDRYSLVSIQAAFPDAVIQDRFSGRQYKVEFEFRASHFIKHQHDPRECDLLVCWNNDLDGFALPVWELFSGNFCEIFTLPDLEKENLYLLLENRRLKNKLSEAMDGRSIYIPLKTGRPSTHQPAVFEYMDRILSEEGRVASYAEVVRDLGLPQSTASRVRNDWLDEHPEVQQ